VRNVSKAYLAGLIVGDGHIEVGTNRIVITTSNAAYKQLVCDALRNLGFSPRTVFDRIGGNTWKISVYSKSFKNNLERDYGIPSGDKTLMDAPRVPDAEIVEFIAGLYDAEGWFELIHGKYFRIRFKVKSKALATFVFDKLCGFGFNAKMNEKDACFSVDLNRQPEIACFLHLFCLYHPRWAPLQLSLRQKA